MCTDIYKLISVKLDMMLVNTEVYISRPLLMTLTFISDNGYM